jgi:acyl carrier protein phosphodiesterase
MNLLAHFYLSHVHNTASSPEVLVGNFIGDFIRGNNFEGMTAEVIRGIKLHRKIDTFTDTHFVARRSASLLKPYFGRYSPAIMDVLYDHILAQEWERFSSITLQTFAEQIYHICTIFRHQMPEQVQGFLPHMIEHNWLVNYRTRYGIERSLMNLSRRAKYGNGFEQAIGIFDTYADTLRADFFEFFPELNSEALMFLLSSQHSSAETLS